MGLTRAQEMQFDRWFLASYAKTSKIGKKKHRKRRTEVELLKDQYKSWKKF